MSNQSNNTIPEWILRRLPYNHYNINVDGKNMHVMEKGKGKPIVLVHVILCGDICIKKY